MLVKEILVDRIDNSKIEVIIEWIAKLSDKISLGEVVTERCGDHYHKKLPIHYENQEVYDKYSLQILEKFEESRNTVLIGKRA